MGVLHIEKNIFPAFAEMAQVSLILTSSISSPPIRKTTTPYYHRPDTNPLNFILTGLFHLV